MESSTVSRQYATMLLDATLENGKWELSKDLVRFLKAIDPNDVESPRTSFIHPTKYGVPQTPSVNPNEEDLSLVLGTMQVSRGRSFSTTVNPKLQVVEPVSNAADVASLRRKKSVPTSKADNREAAGGSAEEFFMDVMVQRHARRLLCEHRLGDLGRLSAHLDFPLVGWLARERDRAARVDCFISALKDLHSDFAWPYPHLVSTSGLFSTRKTSATSVSSAMSSPTLDERVRGLNLEVPAVASKVGDSGYMSQDPLARPTDNPTLLPHLADERSIVSETESWFYGDESEQCTSDSWSDIPSAQLLEQISQEVSACKGSSKAEVQLRYLLQILMEAGCLEWSLIISLMLKDAMAVHRTTNSARSPEHSYEAVMRLKEGLMVLHQWSNTECLGYKPFMLAIYNQVLVLSKLLSTKQPPASVSPPPPAAPKSRTPPRSRTTSSSHDPPSVHSDTLTEPNTVEAMEEVEQTNTPRRESPTPSQTSSQAEQSSCVVS